jgi:Amt family ammonium transporter
MAAALAVMTMIGASLLWVGWFGFNAGSNLEANGVTAVAFINTFVATCAAAVAWALIEQVHHGKASMLGAVTGAVAGLVAITPASGFAAPMTSILLGFVVSPICYFFVTKVKSKLGYDDTPRCVRRALHRRYRWRHRNGHRCRSGARRSGLLRLHPVPCGRRRL